MLTNDITDIMNKLAPNYLVDRSWDNSGLQLGSLEKKIKNIVISLDITPKLILEAINKKIDMIITHHPFFFNPVNVITPDNTKGKMIYDIIKNDIVVFSAHTNLDACTNSISHILAEKLDLIDLTVLSEMYTEKLYKIVVFVPQSHKEIVRNSMTKYGAGHIGNYSHCTFNVKGMGTFMPKEGANPYIGITNSIELVEEDRIETIVSERNIKEVIKAMLSAHPYEEVAYDIYPLQNEGYKYGYGRIGYLKEALTLEELASITKEKFECDSIRLYGNKQKSIKKVAICSGSGSDFIKEAYENNADVFITGDVKYHDAQLALELDIPIIDANHYDTEKMILPYLKSYLESYLGDKVDVLIFHESAAPFLTI
jgi:dinuclear metal center YbgI/SA1388 family protein